ncbi:MAG: glycosyltransferase family 4 protein, partial [Planctomycetes bacterium]|nr:glycosyltransferase family 4 protein [Planctomycetota bacterium]
LKGVAETISAFAKWYHGRRDKIDARLAVVGRDMVEGYRRHAGLRDVGNRVIFAGPDDEIFKWYAAADAFVLLSWYDPCSLTVLEAARWSIPSLTTRFNGAAEAFDAGGCLVVDSPRDTRAIVSALDELADGEARGRHARACAKLADKLSMDRHVDELLEVYAEAARLK